jgi:hypothetical protein
LAHSSWLIIGSGNNRGRATAVTVMRLSADLFGRQKFAELDAQNQHFLEAMVRTVGTEWGGRRFAHRGRRYPSGRPEGRVGIRHFCTHGAKTRLGGAWVSGDPPTVFSM